MIACTKEEIEQDDGHTFSNPLLEEGKWMLRIPDTMNPSTRWFFGADGRFYRQDFMGETIFIHEVDRWSYVDNDHVMISWTRYGDTTLEPPEPDSSLFTMTYLIMNSEEVDADVAFLTQASTFENHYGDEVYSGSEGPNEFPALNFQYQN